MREKLKSILREPRLVLALKSAVFAGFLALLKIGGFGALPILFFLAAAFTLFSYPPNFSFLVLLGIAMVTVGILDDLLFLTAAIALFSCLFYIAAGIKSLTLIHRSEWDYAKNLLLFYAVFLFFFLADKSSLFFIKYLSVLAIGFFLLREWLADLIPDLPRKINFAALLSAFLMAQFLWAVALLPLGPINSANLMVLISYILFDFTSHYFQGKINRQLVMKNVAVLVLLLLVIFATSGWGIS